MVAAGTAYYAYETKAELEAMREAAMAANEKPRYNGAYRDRNAGHRDDPNRVIRFRNPLEGSVAWEDKVKGRIEIANSELDDLVIFRSDGYPTYNFAVVVDDLDMRDHRRRARRRPRQQHPSADQHLPGARRARAAFRAPADDPRPGRREALQAHRRRRRHAVPRRGLPAARAAELPRAAGLVAWRPGDLLDRRDDVVVRPAATSTRRPRAWIRPSSAGSTSST